MNLASSFDVPCLLFVPANRPERFSKAAQACPFGVVIDLEDAVPLGEKAEARRSVRAFIETREDQVPVYVRLNPFQSHEGQRDIGNLADGLLPANGFVLTKVESPRDIEIIKALDPDPERVFMVLIETARGISAASEITAALGARDALAFGGADLAGDLRAEFDWEPLLMARSILANAAARFKLPLFDVPHLHIAAVGDLVSETRRARALGFTGKLAIHPAQVEWICDALAPSKEESEWARKLVEASEPTQSGVTLVDGRMIDKPIIEMAHAILRRNTSSRR